MCAVLWWGNLSSARAAFAETVEAHRRVLALVRQGSATVHGYGYETMQASWMPDALLDYRPDYDASGSKGGQFELAIAQPDADYWQVGLKKIFEKIQRNRRSVL